MTKYLLKELGAPGDTILWDVWGFGLWDELDTTRSVDGVPLTL